MPAELHHDTVFLLRDIVTLANIVERVKFHHQMVHAVAWPLSNGQAMMSESLGEPPTPDAPPPPPMPAPEPNHAPLQVIDGNYKRMSGVCPWWDAVKRGSRPI
jgi:hypothetical protein